MAAAAGRQRRPPWTAWKVVVSPLLVAILTAPTAAQDDPNHGVVFIYPTENQVYHMLDTVNVTYTSPFPTPNLFLWCGGEGGSVRGVFQSPAPGYNATFPVTLNFTSESFSCWFNLRPGLEAGHGANSPDFAVVTEERTSGGMVFGPSSTSTPTVTSTSSSTTRTPTGGTTASTASSTRTTSPTQTTENESAAITSATSAPTPARDSGLSVAAAAGVGAGVAAAVLLVVGGLFAWFWKRRRRHLAGNDGPNGNQEGGPSQGGLGRPVQVPEKQVPQYWADPAGAEPIGAEQRHSPYWNKTAVLHELSSAHTPAEIATSQIVTQEQMSELPTPWPPSLGDGEAPPRYR